MRTVTRTTRSAVAGAVALASLLSGAAACTSDGSVVGAVDGCPDGTVVDSAGALEDGLASAEPGDVLVLRPGTYEGRFVVDRAGTASSPITLCGSRDAVLDGGSTSDGYALHLDGADHWRVTGITIRGAAKGLVLDGSSDNEVVGVAVGGTGEEAVHLRRGSSRNLVRDSDVTRSGLVRRDIGEGIYVGSAEGSWCRVTACEPDRSDDNRLVGNRVSATSAEPIDVKEGTTGGVVSGNRLDGSGSSADSLVDLKGNGWTVEGNVGTASPGNGVAVFRILDGWGEDNVVRGNRFEVAPSGWAARVFGAARSGGNLVGCDNVALVDGTVAPTRITPDPCT